MKIADMKPGMRRIDATGKIIAVEEPRELMTKFGPAQIIGATLQDDSGSIKLILWNENTVLAEVGKYVAIEGGYIDSFRGELQLNVGRYGKISKVE